MNGQPLQRISERYVWVTSQLDGRGLETLGVGNQRWELQLLKCRCGTLFDTSQLQRET
jgi:hypothetical protein